MKEKKLWIRVRFQMNEDDWMEVPMSEKAEWQAAVSLGYIKEAVENPGKAK